MSGEPVIPPGSRAVLIGVPHYQDRTFSSYPVVGNSVEGMRHLLVESGLCGWRADQVSTIVNPENSGQLLSRLRWLARETDGVLLVYFVGHGVLSEQGELCLAIADTDHANPDTTGLEYTKIKRMLHGGGTPAGIRIAILDCCFSGRAIGLGPIGQQLANLSQTSGAYTLTAADDFASSEGTWHTAFTGELLDLLTLDGVPGGPQGLTLGAIYSLLQQRLAARGLPRPNQRSDDSAARFVFTRNAAVTSPSPGQQPWRKRVKRTEGYSAPTGPLPDSPVTYGPPVDSVVYSLSRLQLAINMVGAMFLFACGSDFAYHSYKAWQSLHFVATSSQGQSDAFWLYVSCFLVVTPIAAVTHAFRGKLVLTRRGVRLTRWWTRFIRWSDVEAVEIDRRGFWQDKRRSVIFVLHDRSQIRSPAPLHTWALRDSGFNEKALVIQRWYDQFGSGSVQPWRRGRRP